MTKAINRLLLAFVAVIAVAYSAGAAASPTDTVDTLHQALLTAMKHNGTARERMALLSPKLEQVFDYQRMSSVVAGQAWSQADPSARNAFAQAFGNLSAATYASRFKGYDGERFEIVGTRDGGRGLTLVDTRIIPNGGDAVPLTYVLYQEANSWRIIDVLLSKSISELAVRRSEYNSTLKQSGLPGLTNTLNEKAAALVAS